MPTNVLARLTCIELAPPSYLTFPSAGIDISASGVKLAIVKERLRGLELLAYGEERIPYTAMKGGEIVERAPIVSAVRELVRKHRVTFANVALSESRSYLFEARAEGNTRKEWKTSVEQRLDEYVPLPPSEVAFDIASLGVPENPGQVIGVGYARRVIEETLSVLDEAGVQVRAVENEMFATSRALLKKDAPETVLVIDIGRTTTKLAVVAGQLPRFATTLDIGGDALTLAVQKHLGVSEEEAKRVKIEHGLVPEDGNSEYLKATLSTVSVMREEIARRLDYWQSHVVAGSGHEPVTRAILVGGNAPVRGLPEYLEASLKIPVTLGDVFTNLASRDVWVPPLEYVESLAYSTAIGLALRAYDV